jgi:hypothetical protein
MITNQKKPQSTQRALRILFLAISAVSPVFSGVADGETSKRP